MRLSKIKLVGFKSFVDPTVLHLPSNRVGIVGPNGCGKSNIIDAVRWVMGESSARSLRGETMNDVIFNGSTGRKPVGQASIELLFDNSQGRLGGPWASYGEIAIRRLVSRDGQSGYFLNGTRCRRRDIADLFLGTGLGPRSYAIIEQGMISRVIEARPEELRVFLEEAAGISKYKERRRETETRIRHTRENLDRLNDVREELSRQLQHLQRQARAAEQYRELRAEERRLRAELLALRWRTLQTELHEREREQRRQDLALEALLAEQRRLEARLEAGRARHADLNEVCNETQGRYYQAGADISRLEHDLQHQRELRRRREEDWRQIETALGQLEAQQVLDQTQRDTLVAALAAAEPELAQALTIEMEAGAVLSAAEDARREGQTAWEAFSQRHGATQREAEVERTRIEHLERQSSQNERRLERLRFEQAQLTAADLTEELVELRAAEQAAAEYLRRAQDTLACVEAEANATREARRQVDRSIQTLRERVQIGRGRLTSLQTLQEAALNRHEGELGDWLYARGLMDAPRLAEQLEVEPGWEAAVEAVLADTLDAVCVANLDGPAQTAAVELTQGRLTLIEPPPDAAPDAGADSSALALKVRAPWPLASLLAGMKTAATVERALARRAELRDGEITVTADGVLCGRHWLRLNRGGEEGILAREREIRRLEAALIEDEAALGQQETELERLRERARDLELQRREAQQAVNHGHRDHVAAQGRLTAALTREEQARARGAALAEEIAELDAQSGQDQEYLQLARKRLEEALLTLKSLEGERAELDARRKLLDEWLQECRGRADAARQSAVQRMTALESLRVRAAAVAQALERLAEQGEHLRARRERLSAERTADTDAALAAVETELAAALERRLRVETELQAARHRLEAQDAELQADEQARARYERQADNQRRVNEERRLATSEARFRQQNLREQLHELATDPETVLSALPEAATETERMARLEQVERRIQRLGPINLAAIEECVQVAERKQYLDAQNGDLLEALNTLENAMRKMDRETRARFRETFDQVNTAFGELFPRLFGGGQAHLEITGEDVLDAGVAIMAKPPGKRIGSLSLLSGGEKALTAIALVFAIFQLNPAPFCLLDEVDAPLDDANIGRFGALLQDLSARVQFIFVTHNKATMEIAQHLAGVTMQEPGVSRLVAVDVEEAARLALVG